MSWCYISEGRARQHDHRHGRPMPLLDRARAATEWDGQAERVCTLPAQPACILYAGSTPEAGESLCKAAGGCCSCTRPDPSAAVRETDTLVLLSCLLLVPGLVLSLADNGNLGNVAWLPRPSMSSTLPLAHHWLFLRSMLSVAGSLPDAHPLPLFSSRLGQSQQP